MDHRMQDLVTDGKYTCIFKETSPKVALVTMYCKNEVKKLIKRARYFDGNVLLSFTSTYWTMPGLEATKLYKLVCKESPVQLMTSYVNHLAPNCISYRLLQGEDAYYLHVLYDSVEDAEKAPLKRTINQLTGLRKDISEVNVMDLDAMNSVVLPTTDFMVYNEVKRLSDYTSKYHFEKVIARRSSPYRLESPSKYKRRLSSCSENSNADDDNLDKLKSDVQELRRQLKILEDRLEVLLTRDSDARRNKRQRNY
jgi:hypothetical protein